MSVTSRAAAPRIARVPPIGQRLRAGRVVVGVDGSPGSGAAVRWAAAVASRRHAALRMVSAWQEGDQDPALGALADLSLTAASRVQDALDDLLHQLDRPQRVSCVTPRGVPGEVLVQQAETAELLVLGASDGTGPGVTGIYCIRFARCPVVFVPA